MAQYLPDPRDNLEPLISDLLDMFAHAERRMLRAVALQLRTGYGGGANSPARALSLADLQHDAAAIVAWLRQAYPDQVTHIAQVAAERGVDAALQELSGLADVQDLTTTARIVGASAAHNIAADLTNTLDDVTRRVLRFPQDVYQRAIAASAPAVVLGAGSTTIAQQSAWNRLLDGGVTGFTDVAGRRWNLATYVEMATRSASRRAWDDAKVAAMRQNGVNLVSVVVGNGACQECAHWAGKILRTDEGAIGSIKTASLADPTRQVTVRVAGTLDGAKADGWRHPNCRCSTVAYLPGLSTIADVTHYDADAEAARAKLRDLEVRVRKAKTDAAVAVTTEGAAAANAQVRELQTQIREHIADTGLMRQRNREQPVLGNRRL